MHAFRALHEMSSSLSLFAWLFSRVQHKLPTVDTESMPDSGMDYPPVDTLALVADSDGSVHVMTQVLHPIKCACVASAARSRTLREGRIRVCAPKLCWSRRALHLCELHAECDDLCVTCILLSSACAS